MKSLLGLIVLFGFTSCSSMDLSKFIGGGEDSSDRNEQLMKDLELDDKYLEKFKEKKKPEVKEVERNVEENVEKKDVKKKPIKNKTPKKKLSQKKKKELLPTKLKEIPVKKKAVKPAGISYPDHVSQKYKDFDKNSKTFWKLNTPMFKVGESATYKVSYLGVNTGNINISVKENSLIGEKETYHVHARVKTASYYSYLYEVDDICDSYIDIETKRPLKFSLIQRESAQDIDDLQLFDFDEFKVFTFYKRTTKEKTKKKKNVQPTPYYYQDPLSVLFFMRGLPMNIGKYYDIPILNKGKAEILRAKVARKQTIDTKLGKKEAFRVEINSKHEGKTIKGGKMLFWFTTDESRTFLKFEAKIKIGRITGEIIDLKR